MFIGSPRLLKISLLCSLSVSFSRLNISRKLYIATYIIYIFIKFHPILGHEIVVIFTCKDELLFQIVYTRTMDNEWCIQLLGKNSDVRGSGKDKETLCCF